MKKSARLLVTDLDDTVWHWFRVWHAAFSAELNELTRVTGLSELELIPEIKAVHEAHHTSEYAFLLQELPSLRKLFGPSFSPKDKLPTVIHEYRKARKAHSGLYPDVMETLVKIRSGGTRIIAFTESQTYYSIQRLKRNNLDGIIDVLYAPEESGDISPETIADSREHGEPFYSLEYTRLNVLPKGLRKPSPLVLSGILADERIDAADAVYVGDTLSKDIAMANDAGVFSAHAQYGETHRHHGYDLLKKVTHWTAADVQQQIKANPAPNVILDQSFEQILEFVNFKPTH